MLAGYVALHKNMQATVQFDSSKSTSVYCLAEGSNGIASSPSRRLTTSCRLCAPMLSQRMTEACSRLAAADCSTFRSYTQKLRQGAYSCPNCSGDRF